MTLAIAFLAVLVPASVTLVGYWIKRQSDKRLAQEQAQSDTRLSQERDRDEKRLEQQHSEEQARLRLDAAMRAADLFGRVGETSPSSASIASGLLALTQLGRADLAVALLVDLWSAQTRVEAHDRDGNRLAPSLLPGRESSSGQPASPGSVSTETAVLVINAALSAEDLPNAQLIAAELLCRNATRLDPCQSLYWPAAIDGRWIPGLAPEAKLLIMEGLIRMTTRGHASENALRTLSVRLYGAWKGDSENKRVQGCIGTLIASVLPALERLKYSEFMQARETVTLNELRDAAMTATTNPDGFLDKMVENFSHVLYDWSSNCGICDFTWGELTTEQIDAGV
jgi:hypothetical protein